MSQGTTARVRVRVRARARANSMAEEQPHSDHNEPCRSHQATGMGDTSVREWRCEHCGWFFAEFQWLGGIFVLSRKFCPHCRKPVKSLVVNK